MLQLHGRSPAAILVAIAIGVTGPIAATPAGAEPLVRGSKARIVTNAAGPARTSRADTGYYVPYVTGPGGAQVPITQIPGSVTVVPRSLMDDQQATTLGEALRNVPGVTVGR